MGLSSGQMGLSTDGVYFAFTQPAGVNVVVYMNCRTVCGLKIFDRGAQRIDNECAQQSNLR
jgi:hypothetical protein